MEPSRISMWRRSAASRLAQLRAGNKASVKRQVSMPANMRAVSPEQPCGRALQEEAGVGDDGGGGGGPPAPLLLHHASLVAGLKRDEDRYVVVPNVLAGTGSPELRVRQQASFCWGGGGAGGQLPDAVTSLGLPPCPIASG